ncbi:MAG: spore coat protein [Clostridia bacterium]|nr:spore coat protein [Clostridia bacterium]
MNMQLTQKESGLLKDLKDQERICIEKYKKHSSEACDPQLKNLFSQIAGVEQQHLDTLTQIENGGSPSPGSGSQSGQGTQSFTPTYSSQESEEKKNDCYLCSDVLSTEKHASHLYDECVFEFKDQALRDTLNHIQKEEQGHGKMIYDYMAANGMYS